MTNQVIKQENVMVVGDQSISYTLTLGGDPDDNSRTFLLIHGAMGNSVTTADLATQLAIRFPKDAVFQIDLPGHGKSVGTPLTSISEIAKVLKEFIVKMQVSCLFTDEIVLIGHSMGGSISMQLVLDGLAVKQLVLLSSSPEWSSMVPMNEIPDLPNVIEGAFKAMMVEDFKANTTEELQNLLIPQIESMAASAEASVSDIKALTSFDVRSQLSEIKSPVLVVYGDNDPTATLENQKLMLRSFPLAKEYIIAGGSHTTVIKNFEVIAEAIEDLFLKTVQ